jgi:hypothetical protein
VLTRNQGRLILFLVAIAFVPVVIGCSHSFERCIQTIKHYPAYDNSDDNISTFVGLFHHFRLIGQCEAVAVDKHNGLVAAFAGLIVACFTYTLWRSTEKLWKAGDEQITVAKVSAAAAKDAAIAARDQVELSREALITTERAFVVLNPFWHKNETVDGVKGWSFRCIWKNTGNTPTKFMLMNFNRQWRVVAGQLPLDDDFKDGDNAGPAFLGPQNERGSAKLHIPEDVLNLIQMGQAHAYLWGWAEYNDVFVGTPRHRTEFCVEIVVVGDPTQQDCGFGYMSYGPFNGMDDECLRRPTPYIQNKA